ncbi:hypothetical protein LguiA_030021 [Lonicera macranthoides]
MARFVVRQMAIRRKWISREITRKRGQEASSTERIPKTKSCHPKKCLSCTTLSDEPTSAYYDDLINAAGRQRDFTTVFHLLNKRVRDGCFNTKSTFKFLSTDLSKIIGR